MIWILLLIVYAFGIGVAVRLSVKEGLEEVDYFLLVLFWPIVLPVYLGFKLAEKLIK
jgi:hypothetical protein